MPLISIIIPVYNTEKYLRKCLASVCAQTLKDIEIIVVNDGSTDGSLSIIEEYVAKDKRIKLINEENSGQSSARNLGIEIATGQYIGFVDSDDWIEKEMFEKLFAAAEKEKADVAICNFNVVYEDENKASTKALFNIKNQVIEMDEVGVENYIFQYIKGFKHGNEVYTRLYSLNLIKENKISFEKNAAKDVAEIAEDMLFNLKCSLHIKKIVQVEASPYNYLVRPGSSTTNEKPDLILRYIKLVEKFESFGKGKIEDKQLKKIVFRLIHSIFKEEILRFIKAKKKAHIIKEISSCYDNQYLNKILSYSTQASPRKISLRSMESDLFRYSLKKRHIAIYVALMQVYLKIK